MNKAAVLAIGMAVAVMTFSVIEPPQEQQEFDMVQFLKDMESDGVMDNQTVRIITEQISMVSCGCNHSYG